MVHPDLLSSRLDIELGYHNIPENVHLKVMVLIYTKLNPIRT